MPVLKFRIERFKEVLPELPLDKLLEMLQRIKGEIEEVSDEYIEVEFEVDRPDLYTCEGIARYLKGLIGEELGAPKYELYTTPYRVYVEKVPSRPYIAVFVVENVRVDNIFFEELIQFQEKLHIGLGGRRRRVAIGLHDLEKLPSKTLYYRFADIDAVKFKPLNMDTTMSLREVLTNTRQGREYGSISLQNNMHPILYAGDEVISAPPVINADITRVEPGTKHLLVDVTGEDLRGVLDVSAVLAATLAERGGRRIGIVRVDYEGGDSIETPDMKPREIHLETSYIKRILGVDVGVEEAANLLRSTRFDVEVEEDKKLHVVVPRYRVDVLHPVDLVEEIAIAIGYEKLEPRRPEKLLRPMLLPVHTWEKFARLILAGYGFIEVMSFTLTSCKEQKRVCGLKQDEMVILSNPVSVELDCLRSCLLHQLLEVAAKNQNIIPLKLFELGEVVVMSNTDTGVEARNRLALLVMDHKAGYEDIQSYVYGLIRLMGDSILAVKQAEHPALIRGRTATIETRHGVAGVMGEVKPEILEEYGITYPVAVAELDYTKAVLRGAPLSPAPNT